MVKSLDKMALNIEDPRDSFISPRPMMQTTPHPTPQVSIRNYAVK